MPRNNVKIFNKEEMNTINSLLITKVDSEKYGVLIYGTKRPNRATFHDGNKSFRVNMMNKIKHSLYISPVAIRFYIEMNDANISLFDVQNAINLCWLQYEPITKMTILNNIKKFK